MPSRKGMEQAITWLNSKMAEKDTLDAVNAELTYNVIMDLQKKRKVIGALYHQAHVSGKAARQELKDIREAEKERELEELYSSAIKALEGYSARGGSTL